MNRPRVLPVDTAAREHRRTQIVRGCWVIGAAVLMLAVTVQPFRDTDVWWHLAMGQYITVHGIPTQEPFSFLSAAHPWVGQQWLYEVLLAGMVGAGGPGLASVVMGVVAVCALAIAAAAVPRGARVPGIALAVGVVLSGLVMAQLVGVRGQVITLLGVAGVLFVVTRWREGRAGYLWLLPPLFLLWANLHAGFIAGFAVLLLALLLARPLQIAHCSKRQLALATGAAALATLVNPAGPALYGYVAETFLNPTLTQLVTEWQSPDFHSIWLQLFEVEAVLLVILWAVSGGPDRLDIAVAVGLLVASLEGQRNVSLFAVAAAPQLALYGHRAWQLRVAPRLRRPPALRLPVAAAIAAPLLVAAAVALTIGPQLTTTATTAFEDSRYPAAAATYYGGHFPGQRVLSPDTWGGYLAYRFPQGRVVFLYDETAVFGNADLQTYLDIAALHDDWTQVLTQYGIQHAILPMDSADTSALHELGWTIDCVDGDSAAVVMSAPASHGQALETASVPLTLPSSDAPAC